MSIAFLYQVMAAVPDPGTGKRPPGFDGFDTILSWAVYIAIAMCVLGLIVCGGTMAIEHKTGSGGGVGGRVGSVMIGCIIIGSASAIVATLL